MIHFPHAKINIGLHILGKREDGYHELDSILYPIGLCDILEQVPGQEAEDLLFESSGSTEKLPPEGDLVEKAYRSLPEAERATSSRVHLHKRIPAGAGLGGGSSDAAFLLRSFIKERKMDPFDPEDPWSKRAATLGSDVPFFLQDGPVRVKGRGEKLTPYPIDLSGIHLLLIVPPVHISTGQAYKRASDKRSTPIPDELHSYPIEEWNELLRNDLEEGACEDHPELKKELHRLREMGASFVSMTGSGSGVYGLFRSAPGPTELPADRFEWREELPPLISGRNNK